MDAGAPGGAPAGISTKGTSELADAGCAAGGAAEGAKTKPAVCASSSSLVGIQVGGLASCHSTYHKFL